MKSHYFSVIVIFECYHFICFYSLREMRILKRGFDVLNNSWCQQKFLKHKQDGLNVILDSLQQKYSYVGYYLLVS